MRTRLIKSIIFSISILSLSVVSSCKKSLDIDNPLTSSQDEAFSTLANAEGSLVGVYAELPGDNGYGSRLSLLMPYGADDFKVSGAWNPEEGRGISHYGASATNRELEGPFNQLYRGIEKANICIKYIPLSPITTGGSDAEKAKMNKMLGEALTLRALFYHELIRNWGDVPAHFEPASDTRDLYLPKTNRDIIYDRLLEDLQSASTLVPWKSETSENTPTRITKAAVKGLRARIALARGGYSLRQDTRLMERRSDYLKFYEIARSECQDIISKGDHNLNASFEDLFKALHKTKSVEPANEIIFSVGAGGSVAATNTKLGYGNGIRILQGNITYGRANGALEAVPTYFYEFDKLDKRRDVTLAIYQINVTDQKELQSLRLMRDGKFRKYWTDVKGDAQNLGINWPILRYADVLLMFAEAENELNGPAGATNAFKQVRQRAFAAADRAINVEAYTAGKAIDKDVFREAIKQERLLEFGGEGIRKYDLIRWNDLATKITETHGKLRNLRDGTGQYVNVPNTVYYRRTPFTNQSTVYAEQNTLDLFGGSVNEVMFKPNTQTATPPGYTAVAWRSSLVDPIVDRYIGGTDGLAHKFEANKRELLPISQNILNQNYKLTQNYGY
jgi:starch-binding outer membrane protein, SusD/RagB family